MHANALHIEYFGGVRHRSSIFRLAYKMLYSIRTNANKNTNTIPVFLLGNQYIYSNKRFEASPTLLNNDKCDNR